MAQMNQVARRDAVKTHEGGRAQLGTPEQQLRRAVTACLLWENTFYENGVDIAKRIHVLASQCKQKFVADLAVHVRREHGIRHAPLWLALSLLKEKHAGGVWASKVIADVVGRADELAEIIAMQWEGKKEGKLPNALKRGVAQAFNKFDGYQLAKYNRKDKPVTLRDAMFLCHPKGKDKEQQKVFDDLAADNLASPDTWEVALSGGEDKKETFTRLLHTGRIGYLATLRNVRNMVDAGVDRKLIVQRLESEKGRRGILPFQFVAAATMNPNFEQYLETPMLSVLEDMRRIEGKTAIIVDGSASMAETVSEKSKMTCMDAACGMAIMIRELCDDVSVHVFAQDSTEVPARRGFALRDAIKAPNVGYATYGNEAVKKVTGKYPDVERIVLVTDMQLHDRLAAYQSVRNKYVVNVCAYRHGVGYGNWSWVEGFSDQTVRFIQELEALDAGHLRSVD